MLPNRNHVAFKIVVNTKRAPILLFFDCPLNLTIDCDFGFHNKGIMGADCVRVESFLEFLGVIQI